MGLEIERKFLVTGPIPEAGCSKIVQAYLSLDPERTVRVRIDSESAFLTIKGVSHGATRTEYEYPIPLGDAQELLKHCIGAPIEKLRYRVPVGSHVWEVDVFGGSNEGLVVAEIELRSESESFEKPGWIGEEVTADKKYLNACLVREPYSTWR